MKARGKHAKIIPFLLLLFCFIFYVSCGSYKKAMKGGYNSRYNKDAISIHPQFHIYHLNDSLSQLSFSLNAKEFLYTKPLNESSFTNNISIAYQLKSASEQKEIIDSATVKIADKQTVDLNKKLLGTIFLKALSPEKYLLEVTVTDLNRSQSITEYFDIDKTNTISAQNFLVKKKSGVIAFSPYFKAHEEVLISCRKKNLKTLFVRFYNRSFPIATPPFSLNPPSIFGYTPDSSFTIYPNDSSIFQLGIHKKGFYYLQADSARKEGLTLFHFFDDFPELSSPEELIEPLVYITSKQEYERMLSAVNKKVAVEEFWTKISGSQDRAKELIRKYYNRTKDANVFFSSYLEGWKTDRGMIYIIFGAPNVIYRSSTSETWVYGEENNFMSLSFSFSKVSNPFSNNDFLLDRSSIYKASWYRAVDTWRQGRIYMDN